ncbi:MAG: CopG family transcriptional regulator [Segatella sp.]
MSNNRGGARPNAGRKFLGKVPLCSRVSQQAKERLNQLATKRGVSISDMLEVVINSFNDR